MSQWFQHNENKKTVADPGSSPHEPVNRNTGFIAATVAVTSLEPPMTTDLQSTPSTTLTTHEHIGFELGWDYAHYGLTPPIPYALEASPLRHGWLASQATFGERTLEATRHARKWLQLRLHAWLRGRSVELVQVTPHYLQQLEVTHCPVTRIAFGHTAFDNAEASIDRVRNDASYAAGNLAVISTKANHAKAAYGYREALQLARQIESSDATAAAGSAPSGLGGLTAAQWSRVAVLCSFVEPLPHAEACALPMLVLPPNRLRLFNPSQALQAFISQQLLVPGWSHRLSRLEDLLPTQAIKRSFQMFFHALLPRVLEAGKTVFAHESRWAIEDAWRNPLAQQRWTAFVSQLTPEQCESIVERASAKKLGVSLVQHVSDSQAIDGWNLETRGYVPHAVLRRRLPAQAQHSAHQLSLLPTD